LDIIVDTERELTSNNKITTTIFLAVCGRNSFIIKYQSQFVIKIVYGTMLELDRYLFCILFVDLFIAKPVTIIIIAVEKKERQGYLLIKRRSDTFVDSIVYY
jgi:hypothetical protein